MVLSRILGQGDGTDKEETVHSMFASRYVQSAPPRSYGTLEAHRMGRCQPKCATGYSVGWVSWSRTSIFMAALTSSYSLLVICAMALNMSVIPAASSQTIVALWVVALSVSLSHSVSELLLLIPSFGSRAFSIRLALVPGTYGLVGVPLPLLSRHWFLYHSSLCIRSSDKPLHVIMLRERPRMGSRRGGSRGRATHQRSTPTSDPSSNALESGRSNSPATKSGRGRGRGRVRIDECEHNAHPMVRYRISCSLANSSFIVSVTIEKCETARGSGVAHPGVLVDQRMANPIDNQRQVMGGLSVVNFEADAGPSAPVRGEPTGSKVHQSDSEDSLQFRCRVVEEPYTSEDD